MYGTSLAIYYNKEIYQKLGLEEPQKWSEFIDNCEIIKNNSFDPVAFMGQKKDAVHWMSWHFTNGLMEQKLLGDPNINYNGDQRIDTNEIVKAIYNGSIDFENDKEMQQLYIKYLNKYNEFLSYCPGAADMDETVAKTMFISGKAAHYISGSWDMHGLCMNNNLDFEVGIMKFPDFEESDSEYYGTGLELAASQPVAVTTAVNNKEGKKEAAIDFLMFLTSKDVYKQFLDITGNISVLKDVKGSGKQSVFPEKGAPITLLNFAENRNDVMSFGTILNSLINSTLEMPTQDIFRELQKSIRLEANDLAENNNWNTENDFGIPKLVKSDGIYAEKEKE